jgi:hypothetical protein
MGDAAGDSACVETPTQTQTINITNLDPFFNDITNYSYFLVKL